MLVFSRILRALTEVLGRDIRANDPWMSAEYPSPELPLWADFSFLNILRGTPRTYAIKTPGLCPTIRQLKRAPVRGTEGP